MKQIENHGQIIMVMVGHLKVIGQLIIIQLRTSMIGQLKLMKILKC